jgi:hypothetical protein
MGGIVFWAIIRAAFLIPTLWMLYGMMEYKYWWWFGIFTVYGVIIYPATIQYRIFLQKNEEIINNTLCSSCSNFDETAVICLIHDKHPTKDFLPCEGVGWEPVEAKNEKKEIPT